MSIVICVCDKCKIPIVKDEDWYKSDGKTICVDCYIDIEMKKLRERIEPKEEGSEIGNSL